MEKLDKKICKRIESLSGRDEQDSFFFGRFIFYFV